MAGHRDGLVPKIKLPADEIQALAVNSLAVLHSVGAKKTVANRLGRREFVGEVVHMADAHKIVDVHEGVPAQTLSY